MSTNVQKRKVAGIYAIRHKPSGLIYVGQANDIYGRWAGHRKALIAGSHHNKRLQMLWDKSSSREFDFQVVTEAPESISSLQLQRWLVKEERKLFQVLKRKNLALNEIDPEIVPTTDAVKEYRRERERKIRSHDKEISAKRRHIKETMNALDQKLSLELKKLKELEGVLYEKKHEIWKHTSWRKIFYQASEKFNIEYEKNNVVELQRDINLLSVKTREIYEQIQMLNAEYRDLYNSFTKVAERNWQRSRYRIGLRYRGYPKITE